MGESKDLRDIILRLYRSQEDSVHVRKSGYLRATRLIAMMESNFSFIPRYEEIVTTDNFNHIFLYDPKGSEIGLSSEKVDQHYLDACYHNANQQDFWNNIGVEGFLNAD